MKPTKLPNPRPAQSKKDQVKSGIWATFFPQQVVFRGLGLILYRKQTTRNNPAKFSANTLHSINTMYVPKYTSTVNRT